jgi:hypothetical protein
MIVGAPLQSDNGFILQQCPFCTKYFRVHTGKGANQLALYCPYCGRQWSNWYTAEQVAYLEKVALDYPKPPPEPPDDAGLLKKKKMSLKDHIFVDCGHGDIIQHDGSQKYLHCIICGDIHEQHSPERSLPNKPGKKPKR